MSRTHVLNTRDIKEVDTERLKFIEHLKSNNFITEVIPSPDIEIADKFLLAYQMKRYLDYITNGGFYEFEAPKELTTGTINDYKRNFKYFFESIARSVNIKTLRIDQLQLEHIELFHKYIKKKTSSNKTYNNIMSSLRTFYNHLIKYEKFDIDNLFDKVPVLSVDYDPQSFSAAEFNKVLSVTTIEQGYDEKEKRNRYRDWLPTAFKLGAFTGLRLEEIVNLKYNDITNIDGILVMESVNRKANKLISDKSNRRIKRIPVIPELLEVLTNDCNYSLNKGKDEYILAPALDRNSVKSIITKGFTHFKRIAGIDENKCFKELRTTYISRHRAEIGDRGLTSIISDHSNSKVVDKHYTAQIEAIKKSSHLRIFSTSEERVN
jgi:integrase